MKNLLATILAVTITAFPSAQAFEYIAGGWSSRSWTDPLTDKKGFMVMNASDKGRDALLSIGCGTDESEKFIFAVSYVKEDEPFKEKASTRVLIRLDKSPAMESQWKVNKQVVFLKERSAVQLLNEMEKAQPSRLVIGAYADDERYVAQFPTEHFSEALDYIRANCAM